MAKRSRKPSRKSDNWLKRNQTWLVIAGVVVALAVIVITVRQSSLGDIDLSIPDRSEAYPIVSREHIAAGETVDPEAYNSNPPTSGPHSSSVRTGVYQQELPDENLVHNLEHGHIWLSYRDADDTEAIELLSAIQARFPRTVVVTYRPRNDTRVAVAAWGRLLKIDGELNEDEILAFIARYADKAPESVPG
ncbi:MAG: DUF3105 domain-containing protein [Chloroflexi bacterium]|nr:MAG: DUF3105 domain-containing protein [Chloroflexota bacterium]